MTPVKSVLCFFFSSRRRHTRYWRDWSSDVCSSDLGEVHSPLDSTHVASAVGINLVTSVVRVEGHRLWVLSTSGSDSGWVDSADVRRLPDAIPYFTGLIERDPGNWDAYLRRAEAEHALNQRDAATADYNKAI